MFYCSHLIFCYLFNKDFNMGQKQYYCQGFPGCGWCLGKVRPTNTVTHTQYQLGYALFWWLNMSLYLLLWYFFSFIIGARPHTSHTLELAIAGTLLRSCYPFIVVVQEPGAYLWNERWLSTHLLGSWKLLRSPFFFIISIGCFSRWLMRPRRFVVFKTVTGYISTTTTSGSSPSRNPG